jgi:SAM-dependent methyltransferase
MEMGPGWGSIYLKPMTEKFPGWEVAHAKKIALYLTDSNAGMVLEYHDVLHTVARGSGTFMDVGVGTGRMATHIARLPKWRLVMCDVSTTGLRNAEAKYEAKARRDDHVALYPADLPHEGVDLAVAHLVAQHLDDGELTYLLRGIVGSLKTSGLASIQFADCSKSEDELVEKFGPVPLHFRSVDEMAELVEPIAEATFTEMVPVYRPGGISWSYMRLKK